MRWKLVILFVLVGCLVLGGLASVFYTSDPRIVLHTAKIPWLPSAATDISTYETTGFAWLHIYECTIPEADFVAMAHSQGWKLRSAQNVVVDRVPGLPRLRDADNATDGMILVPNALIYHDRKPNGGGFSIVFDRELSRMFYDASAR